MTPQEMIDSVNKNRHRRVVCGDVLCKQCPAPKDGVACNMADKPDELIKLLEEKIMSDVKVLKMQTGFLHFFKTKSRELLREAIFKKDTDYACLMIPIPDGYRLVDTESEKKHDDMMYCGADGQFFPVFGKEYDKSCIYITRIASEKKQALQEKADRMQKDLEQLQEEIKGME